MAKAVFSVSLLRQLLGQVTDGGYILDKIAEECGSILQALGPPDGEEGDQLQNDYTSKQLEDLRKLYQAIVSRGQHIYGRSGEMDEALATNRLWV